MTEGIVLGAIQGIAEWLPVSSEGLIALAALNVFGYDSLLEIVRLALFLHLGTFLAALVYFRHDVWQLLGALARYRSAKPVDQAVLRFLIIATVLSGAIGLGLLGLIGVFENEIQFSGRIFTGLIGGLLLITAWLQLKKKAAMLRDAEAVTTHDALVLGLAQGLAALPGLSRSGLTVAALLLRGVREETALRLSFLLSLPIVLAGNIALNFTALTDPASLSVNALTGLVASFIFGLITIDLLLKLARRIQFGYFVGVFGILMLVAALL